MWGTDLSDLAEDMDMDSWRAFVKAVTNIWAP